MVVVVVVVVVVMKNTDKKTRNTSTFQATFFNNFSNSQYILSYHLIAKDLLHFA